MTMRDFQRLRERARTAGEFRTLAQWCQARSDYYREKQLSCEAELQRLQTLAESCAELSGHWRELAGEYSERAAQLETGVRE